MLIKIKDVLLKNYGLSIFGIYLMIIFMFAKAYHSIYLFDSSDFLVSNSTLEQRIKEQNMTTNRQSLESTEQELKSTHSEINKYKILLEAFNMFQNDTTDLVIKKDIKPDSVFLYRRTHMFLSSITKNNVQYLTNPVFENRLYRYELVVNLGNLKNYFIVKNYDVQMHFIIEDKKTKKNVYSNWFSYHDPSFIGKTDIKTFFSKSILIMEENFKYSLKANVEESQKLNNRKHSIETQLKDLNHYLSFWDFLYFSTITQSSTGYGDILPNSRLIRMLVTAQIILGLFVIGIAINFRPKENRESQ